MLVEYDVTVIAPPPIHGHSRKPPKRQPKATAHLIHGTTVNAFGRPCPRDHLQVLPVAKKRTQTLGTAYATHYELARGFLQRTLPQLSRYFPISTLSCTQGDPVRL